MPPPVPSGSSTAVVPAPSLAVASAGTSNSEVLPTLERIIAQANEAAAEARAFFAEQQAQQRDFMTLMFQQARQDREQLVAALNNNNNNISNQDGQRHLPPHLQRPAQPSNAVPAAAPPVIPAITVNIADPAEDAIPKFYGKDVYEGMAHIAACENAFRGRNAATRFGSDEAKIRFSLQACEAGDAATWKSNGLFKLNSGPWMALSWAGYVEEFKSCFGWVQPHHAVAEIVGTFQKPGESVSSFLLTTDQRVIASKWDASQDPALISILRAKMNPDITKKIPMDTTKWTDFKRLATEADKALQEHKAAKNAYLEATRSFTRTAGRLSQPVSTSPATSSSTSPAPSSSSTPSSSHFTSFTTSSPQSTTTPLSDPNKPRRMLCYTCRKEGHTANSCPDKGKARAHTVTMVEEAEEHRNETEFEIEVEEEDGPQAANAGQDF